MRESTVDEKPAQPLLQGVDRTTDIRQLCGRAVGQRGGRSRVNTVANRKPTKMLPKIDEGEGDSGSEDSSDDHDSASSSD